MHDALGLAGGARGVDQLGDVIGPRARARKNLGRIGLTLPGGARQARLEAVGALTAHRQYMLQMWQLASEARHHLRMIESSEHLGHDHDLGFAMTEHEGELALTKDVHERIDDRADARAGERGERKLPPVGQLHGHDIVATHTQAIQTHGDAIGHGGHLAVGEAAGITRLDLNRG